VPDDRSNRKSDTVPRMFLRVPVVALLCTYLLLSACLPTIPMKTPGPRATLAEGLPQLAPCALVHLTVDRSLSDGAHGWFRGVWKQGYGSFLIRRPQGAILIDAGFGDTTGADLDAGPWWFRFFSDVARPARSIAALLAEAGVKPEEVTHVLITHDHYDHTGGLPQLPNARVVMGKAEADFVLAHDGPFVEGAMPQHFAKAKERLLRLTFPDGPIDGFAASQDVFGDGSVIAVPTAGHTRGSTSYFVSSGDARRWLFVGDAAWVKEGFEEPVTRGRLASWAVDYDREEAADVLGRLHAVHVSKAAIIVTSHDERTWQGVPRCPAAVGTAASAPQ
jgi:glyoxylase-like metal-dependent hydrolase (beta-lactamase superfamily II)